MPADLAAHERRAAAAAAALAEVLGPVEQKRAATLTREQLRSLPARYRRAVAELAEARAAGVSPARLADLEAVVVHAHGLLYAPEPVHLGAELWRILVEFPRAARRFGGAAGLAALLIAAGAVWGWAEVRRDPTAAAVLLSQSLEVNAESFQKDFSPRAGDPVYGAFYFTNNARVALAAYALGATFGAGTVLLMLFNGVVLGATIAIVAAHGSLVALLSYVLPHSGVEMTAIVFAAAAGLHMGRGLLVPGWRTRRDALAAAARESLPLALGSAALLVVAGVTEGWIAPMALPLWMKATVGGVLDALLLAYLLLPGRSKSPEGAAT
ncbi:MAG TPA: stage II sporulation protein M [Myxococcales bacterium]|nr:stage II sporulation protein M [Myxococcales bacterium]